jgi:hypothetical protein
MVHFPTVSFPLRIRDFPMVGPDGRRDGAIRFSVWMRDVLPRAGVFTSMFEHDDGCPCISGMRPLFACTCETVHVTVQEVV